MHPALNYRQSRRSACDRCRGFKLRCERDHVRGRSCERCLKAQVICTTSLSQSAFPSSKVNTPTLPSEYDGNFPSYDRLSMPTLQRHTLSGVQKAPVPSGVLRTHFDPSSYLASGSMALGLDEFAVSSSKPILVPPAQSHNANLSWDAIPSWVPNTSWEVDPSWNANLPWNFNFQTVSSLIDNSKS